MSTFYPFNFANRNGFPMIESNGVEVTETNVVITIPNRAFNFLPRRGMILFRLNTEIPAAGDALPVVFSANGFQQQVTLVGGANAVGTNFGGIGVYLMFYDKLTNVLQLMTTCGTEETTTTNP